MSPALSATPGQPGGGAGTGDGRLIDRMYGGSADLLVANLLGSRRLSRRNWPASSGALKN